MDQFITQNIKRINVVGTSGSGKSTFGKKLAAKMNAPHVEIDRIYWGKNWSEPSDDIFFEKLRTALSGDKWVVDGNYKRTTAIKWANAQMVIWLDYSFALVMMRAIRRALHRIITQKELWQGTGNRESFGKLFSKDSIVMWTFKTHKTNIEEYERVINSGHYPDIKFVRLKSPKETECFFEKLGELMIFLWGFWISCIILPIDHATHFTEILSVPQLGGKSTVGNTTLLSAGDRRGVD